MSQKLVNHVRATVKVAMDEAREDKERKFTPVFWIGNWEKPILIKLFKS
jgi:hypothetical protein